MKGDMHSFKGHYAFNLDYILLNEVAGTSIIEETGMQRPWRASRVKLWVLLLPPAAHRHTLLLTGFSFSLWSQTWADGTRKPDLCNKSAQLMELLCQISGSSWVEDGLCFKKTKLSVFCCVYRWETPGWWRTLIPETHLNDSRWGTKSLRTSHFFRWHLFLCWEVCREPVWHRAVLQMAWLGFGPEPAQNRWAEGQT